MSNQKEERTWHGLQLPGLLEITKFQGHSAYVDVSNVNVGLWLQQAGYSLEDSLRLAGSYSLKFSNNGGAEHQAASFQSKRDF